MEKIVVDTKNTTFDVGQACVAFSCVKTHKGLLSTQSLPSEPIPKILSLPKDSWVKISHLNVH